MHMQDTNLPLTQATGCVGGLVVSSKLFPAVASMQLNRVF